MKMHEEYTVLTSVIVTIYNKGPYLHRCLDSVLAQTFSDFELILVDDGSTDGSSEICKEYAVKDKRVKVLIKNNGGVSSARNIGMEEAKGEWITFVDADDYVDRCYLESLLPQAEEDFVMDSSDARSPHFIDGHYQGKQIFSVALSDWHILCPWGKLYKLDRIRESAIRFDESLSNGEDTLFNLNYLAHVKNLRVASSSYYHYDSTAKETLSKQSTPYEKALYKAHLVYAIGKEMAEKDKDEKVRILISKYAGITWGLWKNLVKYGLPRRTRLVKELFTMDDLRNLMNDYLYCNEGGKRYHLFYLLGRLRLYGLAALLVK